MEAPVWGYSDTSTGYSKTASIKKNPYLITAISIKNMLQQLFSYLSAYDNVDVERIFYREMIINETRCNKNVMRLSSYDSWRWPINIWCQHFKYCCHWSTVEIPLSHDDQLYARREEFAEAAADLAVHDAEFFPIFLRKYLENFESLNEDQKQQHRPWMDVFLSSVEKNRLDDQ